VHPADDELPRRLGEFEIDRVLGQGGSGTVYAARKGTRKVALKVLREDQVPTGKERRRFVDEANHMARISHPGIVKVYGAGELEDGRPYLAMEYLEGTNLAERLARGSLAREAALSLFEQLAAAVAAMHAEGLIHRDLKPENVMLVDGERRAVLLDFGIAKPADAPPSTTTQAGMQRGTPAYMAPERFFGSRATIASDIYELGVILYVMLCGQLPWENPLDAKARLQPRTPAALGVQLPTSVERALLRALSTTEEERPANVEALAGQLREAQWETAPTVLATSETRRERRLVGVYVAAAVVVIGTSVGLTLWLAERGVKEDGGGPAAGERSDHQVAPTLVPPRVSASGPPNGDADGGVRVADGGVRDAGDGVRDAGAGAGAGAGAAVEVAEQKPVRAPRKRAPTVKPPTKTAATGKTPASGKTPGKELPDCRRVLALYCTAEFKASEGTMAGALCKSFGDQVRQWEAMPEPAHSTMAQTCRDLYPNTSAAVKERLRQFRAGEGPPRR